jgi:hypothetical protein
MSSYNNDIGRSAEQYFNNPGPYLARVVSHGDGKYMGALQVELLNDVGRNLNATGSILQVKYLSPFYGVTGTQFLTENNDYDGTQKSYGMWMVPPDVGTTVMVIFVNGNAAQGYWIGCVQDEYMNFMIPGLAATETTHPPSGKRKVVAEFNKKINKLEHADQTQVPKPIHPFQQILEDQGLAEDDVRGITTSSARREVPSTVFGISTPGPVDRKPGAPTGVVGKRESKISNAFISRLGGTTFVMDDGDDNFLRKTTAGDFPGKPGGPPEYASVENGENGIPDIPHNELVRIRTRTGHQILLHNSEDLIYIANARGTAWIELSSNGKIDIYAKDSVSIRTKKDFNFFADENISMECLKDFKLKVGGSIGIEAGGDYSLLTENSNIQVNGTQNITVTSDYKLTIGGGKNEAISTNFKVDVGGNSYITTATSMNIRSEANLFSSSSTTEIAGGDSINIAAGTINLNGPAGAAAASPAAAEIAEQGTPLPLTDQGSVVARIPDHEPWAGHENLHNTEQKYSTATDTFKKIGK